MGFSVEELRAALHYDQETGEFTWTNPTSVKVKPGASAGYVRPDGYRMIRFHTAKYLAHRLGWFYVHGVWPEKFLDHINGVRSDNRMANLREADHSTNGMNRPLQRNSVWGRGVHKAKGRQRWNAEIKTRGVKRYLGSFPTPEQAREAYLDAARAERGEFLRID